MELMRKLSKPIAICLSFFMLMLACPCHSASAAMIGTDSIFNGNRDQSPRDYLNDLLSREDLKAALVSQGIDLQEAQARIDSLSDAEVRDIVDKLDQLPAGGVLGTLLIIAFLVFLILLLTDIGGYTDVFPFVNKK
jgi:hypothetical protein